MVYAFFRGLWSTILWLFPPYWIYRAWQRIFEPEHKKFQRRVENLCEYLKPTADVFDNSADMVELWGKMAQAYLDTHPGDTDAASLMGSPAANRKAVKSLREIANGLRELRRRFEERHLAYLGEYAEYAGDEAFEADMKMAASVLTVVLFGIKTWSIPTRLLIAFPVASGVGWVLAFISLRMRRLMIRWRLGGLLGTFTDYQIAIFS